MLISRKTLSILYVALLATGMGSLAATAVKGEVGLNEGVTAPNRHRPLSAPPAVQQPSMRMASLSHGLRRIKSSASKSGSIHDPYRKGQNSHISVTSGVFGTVAIPFSKIASRPKWLRIQSAFERPLSKVCPSNSDCHDRNRIIAGTINQLAEQNFYAKLVEVNAAVNKLIKYKTDQTAYRALDYWATYDETIAKGEGDCEDFASLKLSLLIKLGIPSRSMSLVVLKDMRRNIFHAVLAVSTNKGHFILDNVRDEVLPDTQLDDYMPLYSFSANRSWIHGLPSSSDMAAKMNAVNLEQVVPGEQFDVPPIAPLLEVRSLSLDLRPTLVD